MSRPTIALLLGLSSFFAYVVLVLAISDHLSGLHWVVEMIFFAVAGVAWVWPAKRLMVWAFKP